MNDGSNCISLGKNSFPVVRFKLREWLKLDEIRSDILEAAEHGNKDGVEASLYSYVSAAFGVSVDDLKEVEWYEIAEAFVLTSAMNIPKLIPMLSVSSGKKSPDSAWDYKGRSWYLWAHIFARAYGWSVEYIANLDLDDAMALSQEIIVEEQLEREWVWSLSEMAYKYDSATQTSTFIKLPRPAWMEKYVSKVAPDEKKMKILKSMMPIGVIIKYGEKPS